MSPDRLLDCPDLTRRRALQAGGGAAAAAFFLLHPWASAAAAAAEGSNGVPGHLLRSSYMGLDNPEFAVGGSTLRLEAVGDLASAPTVRSLRDTEDAFSLVFSGPGVTSLSEGTQRIRHSALGEFDLCVGRVGPPGPDQRIEVVVNRVLSNTESRRTAPKPSKRSSGSDASGVDADGKIMDPGKRRKPPIRQVKSHRTKRGLKCAVELAPDDVAEMTAWLWRGDKVVAATTRKVRGHRVAFTVKPARRLRKGSYELDLMATLADGEQSHLRKKLILR